MAWNTPPPRATATFITAAIWNTDIVGNLRYLKGLDGLVTLDHDLRVNKPTIYHPSPRYWLSIAGIDRWSILVRTDTGFFEIWDEVNNIPAFGIKPGVKEIIHCVIPRDRLKTATGSHTTSGAIYVALHDYSFLPSFTSTGDYWNLVSWDNTEDPLYIMGRIGLIPGSGTLTVRWRYITASDNPEIWIGLDKNGKIVAVWEAEDPAPISPPIESEHFAHLIKSNPDKDTLRIMRENAGGKLGAMIMNEGRIAGDKLSVQDINLDIEEKEVLHD